MVLDKRTREQMLAHCGAIHPDDGVDPRHAARQQVGQSRRGGCRGRKTRQLCQQIGQTLDLLFAEGVDGLELSDLRVVSVRAATDNSRMLVTVVADDLDQPFRRELLASRLQRLAGRLRTEVAQAITRRRAPVLTFVVLGHEAEAA
ncbi:Ribosome-binding factor A [Posidoniimonas polymericola]|uniref:Ribosome-binding factor A n=1 Tax=Posidoniimonas polymericola TaxID=2528002 RepID=A0A5C5YT55_9BACT|nr:ribosome-binding factor A [Posidoniimonas polymericola]TWT77837.1 Ribosome-binding factor A [Posidoniimonas polymericola]